MKIILYTIGCPKCRVLEKKLELKNVSYVKEENIDTMKLKGLNSAPWLEVDGEMLDYIQAVKYINEIEAVKNEN